MSKPRNQKNKALPKYWRFHKGAYSYRVPVHVRHLFGGKSEVSLGKSLAEAYRRFASFTQTDECITLMRELFDRYRFEVVTAHTSANTRDAKNRSLDRLRASMGDNLVTSITPQFIYKYRDHIGKTRSQKQANLDLETLSHCFTKAIGWGVVADHPMTGKKVTKFSLAGRDRYVEDWELQAWASVANPFLVAYTVLKGVTGLRQQDLLTLQKKDITDKELIAHNLKTGKRLRFPLFTPDGEPTSVRLALDIVQEFYAQQNRRRIQDTRLLPPTVSPWLFHTRRGDSYYDMENRRAPGFRAIWQRSMKKALAETELQESFTENDLRAKVGSDLATDQMASDLLAHSSTQVTRKHYRLRGQVVTGAVGFFPKKD